MPQIGFRASDELLAMIDARAAAFGQERSETVRNDLNQLYEAMQDVPGLAESIQLDRLRGFLARADRALTAERRLIRELLSPGEQAVIADHANGVWYTEGTILYLPYGVRDSIEMDGLDKKWVVDGPELVEKLEGFDYCALWALVDACQRYWASVSRGEQRDPRRLLEERER